KAGAGTGPDSSGGPVAPLGYQTVMRSTMRANASCKPVSWEQSRNRSFMLGLLPALAVLLVITLAPAVALFVTSLTPLSLVNPATSFNFSDPLVNFRQLMQDERFL